MLTGKYPHHIGMQHSVIFNDEPFGLGLEQKLMPEYFKEAGYSTHLVGKWHLGFYQKQYWPQSRGFDSFFGYLGPWIDYYDYTLHLFNKNYSRGYDMRRNFDVDKTYDKEYATDIFTREAIGVIENHDKGKPLFLLLAHLAVHSGL
jgi:arylsulfatase B